MNQARAKKPTTKAKPKKFRLAIMNALNSENQSEARNNLDLAVLDYYASLNPKGFDLVLCAAVSSEATGKAAVDAGWEVVRASNKNVGAKRNAGLEYCIENADAVVRIGEGDVASLALLEAVVARLRNTPANYIELYGFAFLDVASQRLALARHKQFAFAFLTKNVTGHKLYNEDGSVIDSGIDIRLRSLCENWAHMRWSDDLPFIACKAGDEINSFAKLEREESKMLEWLDAKAILKKHFPNFKPFQ